jgi:transcriptional regulator with XRE-family HTH domain
MTNIREVLAFNLKKHRRSRGWSQAKLAEKTGTSTQYIGMLEIKGKIPSSNMIQKLASALSIDPTELFCKEITSEITLKNAYRVAFEDVGEAVSQFIADYIAEKVRKLDEESGEISDSENFEEK